MAIRLTITVTNIAATLALGYTHIKVYRSAEQLTGFSEITTPSSIIPLVAGVSVYTFDDSTATTKHWYTTTFFDADGVVAETSQSTAFVGTFVDTRFSPVSYPPEHFFTSDDFFVIDAIRNLIGDPKLLTRDYVSSTTGYDSISEDGFTHTLSNPAGWPLSVTLDGVEYTTLSEPRVNDYQFVTFSGVQVNTTSGTLDVWFDHSRYSDAYVLRVYNALTPPSPLEADEVTFELAALCAAIEILSLEHRLLGAISGSEVDIFQEIKINPKGGITGRQDDLDSLRARKAAIIASIVSEQDGINSSDLSGVLID